MEHDKDILLEKIINDISSKIMTDNKFSPKKKIDHLSNLSKVKTKEELKVFCKKYNLY